jgi:EAL domain-containing protein (putative c-di-GMP-specific phosphodiesterase class I)/CheY-like chemotaxis protein
MTPSDSATRAKPRLLIVDDEPDVAGLIAEVADELGFDVLTVLDGNEVHDAYARHRPDVVTLDLNLPGLDGIELLRFLAEQSCRAQVFIASGMDGRTLGAATAVGKQHNLNIAGALPKPLMVDDITTALEPLLNRRDGTLSPGEIRTALANGEIQVHYQPKIDLLNENGSRLDGVEALVRWIRPDGAMIYPDTFLPIAQEHGLMGDLTETVADQALRVSRQWRDQGMEIVTSVNLDGSMLDDLSLPDHLSAKAREIGVDPSKITIEVTESAAMADAAVTMDILTRLRVKNFNVSIDDFGTGYSSLVQLYRLPFNELKIDKSFVMDIERNDEAAIIVETLAALGQKLGLKICAEGIENRAMLDHVRACGCDLGQGYLFSKPVEASMITTLAKRWRDGVTPADRLRAVGE